MCACVSARIHRILQIYQLGFSLFLILLFFFNAYNKTKQSTTSGVPYCTKWLRDSVIVQTSVKILGLRYKQIFREIV